MTKEVKALIEAAVDAANSIDDDRAVGRLFSAGRAVEEAADPRDAALEEAAALCEALDDDGTRRVNTRNGTASVGDCAAAIRALKEKK